LTGRIRKLLLKGSERLDERGSDRMLLGLRAGDPSDEVLGAWLDKNRFVTSTSPTNWTTPPYSSTRPSSAASDEVDEIQALGRTLNKRRTEILAHHDTGASNGPTEGLNLPFKKVNRCGHGFNASTATDRLRVTAPLRRHRLEHGLPTDHVLPTQTRSETSPETPRSLDVTESHTR
jgi:hypothetical protein